MKSPLTAQSLSALLLAVSASAQIPSQMDLCPEHVRSVASDLQRDYGLAGIQIAVAQFGQLRCAGALGFADRGAGRALTPTSWL